MNVRNGVVGLVLVGCVGGAIAVAGGMGAGSKTASTAPVRSAAAEYKIDGVHSSVVFRVMHINTAYFYGTFNTVRGTMALDPADPTAGSISLEIPIDSVDTRNEKRDGHLKSQDFFNAAKYPTATFKSTSIAKAGEHAYDVAGDLTLHGVTKPITVKLERVGESKGKQGEKIGFDSTVTIKRSDFGMNYMLDGLGDEVRLMIGLECAKQ